MGSVDVVLASRRGLAPRYVRNPSVRAARPVVKQEADQRRPLPGFGGAREEVAELPFEERFMHGLRFQEDSRFERLPSPEGRADLLGEGFKPINGEIRPERVGTRPL